MDTWTEVLVLGCKDTIFLGLGNKVLNFILIMVNNAPGYVWTEGLVLGCKDTIFLGLGIRFSISS